MRPGPWELSFGCRPDVPCLSTTSSSALQAFRSGVCDDSQRSRDGRPKLRRLDTTRTTASPWFASCLFRQDVASWSSEVGELDLTEVVRDTMLAADQDVALQQIAKRKAARETAVEIRRRVSQTFEAVAKTFASRPEYKKAAGARKAKEKQIQQRQKDHAAAIKRCYATLSSDIDKAVKVGVPTAVRVYRDDYNGRWRLTYSTSWAHATRSISWTAVGSKNAAAEALRQGWLWSETFDGLPMPEEAAVLLQKLAA